MKTRAEFTEISFFFNSASAAAVGLPAASCSISKVRRKSGTASHSKAIELGVEPLRSVVEHTGPVQNRSKMISMLHELQ